MIKVQKRLGSVVLGGLLLSLLGACGRPAVVSPMVRRDFASGTGQVTYTKNGLSDSRTYGRGAPDNFGIHCAGEKNEILVEFLTVIPDSRNGKLGKAHLVIKGSHPKGPDSKASDLPAATFKVNWPPQNVRGEEGSYEKSTNTVDQACKLNYRKEKSRGIGTFDCQQLTSTDGGKPEYLRVNGSFNCFVFQNE